MPSSMKITAAQFSDVIHEGFNVQAKEYVRSNKIQRRPSKCFDIRNTVCHFLLYNPKIDPFLTTFLSWPIEVGVQCTDRLLVLTQGKDDSLRLRHPTPRRNL